MATRLSPNGPDVPKRISTASIANTSNVEWEWNIRRVKTATQGDMENVITSVDWTLNGEYIEEDGDQHFSGFTLTTAFPQANNELFIAFEDVQANTIVEWIKEVEGPEEIQYFENKILNKLNFSMVEEKTKQLAANT